MSETLTYTNHDGIPRTIKSLALSQDNTGRFSASERGVCTHWINCNDFTPETSHIDLETGLMIWAKGECLGLFVLIRCETPEKVKLT